MLQVNDLSFRYPGQVVFEDISFSLKQGELCGLLGINGSGKSTLLKCCMGFLKPETGRIRIKNLDLSQLNSPSIARMAAFVPQHHPITFPYLVYEMVLMGRTTHISNFLQVADSHYLKAEEAIKSLHLEGIFDKPFTELSGGQKQMVLIARALAQETPLLLLDEPTSSLDFKNQLLIWNTLRELKHNGKAILVCTHDPNHVLWFCDRVLVLDERRIIADGPPGEVLTAGVLEKMYGPVCHIKQVNDHKMVTPEFGLTGKTK